MDGQQAADFTLTLCRATLRFYGLWPDPKKSNGWFLKYQVFLPLSIIFLFSSIPQTTKLVMIWGDLDKMSRILSTTNLPITLVMFKMILLWCTKEKLKHLIAYIEKDWQNSKTEEERKLMILWAQQCRNVSLLYIFLSQSTFVFYTLQQISVLIIEDWNNYTRSMYVDSYFPYDFNQSPTFELTWLMQGTSIQLGNVAYASTDCFFAILVLHFCGQFRILQQRVLKCVEETVSKLTEWKFHQKLILIVLRHDHLNRCITTIEETFNLMFLAQMLGFSIQFCLQAYILILIAVEDQVGSSAFELCFMLVYILYMVLNFYIYCYIGEIFRKQSTEIQLAAYSCKWYNLKAKNAKFIMLLMHRARKTVDITAGKFCVFSLELFSSIMKTSLGYLSMMLAVKRRNSI